VEWIEALRGSTVGLDTGPLIYYIEEHPGFLAKIKPFFEAAERSEFRMVTSFVTLIEVLVHPLREGRPELAEEYRNILLHSPALTAIPLDEGIAEEAAGCHQGGAAGVHDWNRVPCSTLDQAGLRGVNRRTSASFRDFAKPFLG